jgi:hypothetical protein
VSGWLLGLALFACFLAGLLACGATIYFYARHVWRTKVGQLGAQLLGTQGYGPTVQPGSFGGATGPSVNQSPTTRPPSE